MVNTSLIQYCGICNKPTIEKCPRCKKSFCNKHDASECAVPIPTVVTNGISGPFVKMRNFPKVVDNQSHR